MEIFIGIALISMVLIVGTLISENLKIKIIFFLLHFTYFALWIVFKFVETDGWALLAINIAIALVLVLLIIHIGVFVYQRIKQIKGDQEHKFVEQKRVNNFKSSRDAWIL